MMRGRQGVALVVYFSSFLTRQSPLRQIIGLFSKYFVYMTSTIVPINMSEKQTPKSFAEHVNQWIDNAYQCKAFDRVINQDSLTSVISLILSQRVRFKVGQTYRRRLFTKVDRDHLTMDDVTKNINWEEMKLPNEKLECIILLRTKLMSRSKQLERKDKKTTTPHLTASDLFLLISNIKGIGPWTKKGFQIMTNLSDTIWLAEDLYIKRRFQQLSMMHHGKSLTSLNIPQTKWSDLSRLFWRINDHGIEKMKKGQSLDRTCFL
jgi:3-methyladenine DNA glycosylase/8-oxoguanine DNA glycosylase